MNCQMWPFTDVRVRRALSYAIDRHKLIAILNGRGVVARGVMPPNLPGYDPDLKGYDYDPAKARALLEEAHLAHGFDFEFWMRADQTQLMLAQSIQQDLAPFGIHAKLKPVAWGPFLEAIRQPKTVQAFMQGWEADFPDPENFLGALLSRAQWGSNNDTFYSNPEVEQLLAEAEPLADMKQALRALRPGRENRRRRRAVGFPLLPGDLHNPPAVGARLRNQSDAPDALRACLAFAAS